MSRKSMVAERESKTATDWLEFSPGLYADSPKRTQSLDRKCLITAERIKVCLNPVSSKAMDS